MISSISFIMISNLHYSSKPGFLTARQMVCPALHLEITSCSQNLVHAALALSGEPMISQITATYGTLQEEYTASKIAAHNVAKRAYQKEYMEYWNSTSSSTDTDRPVDAVITPVAPFAAARPNLYSYYGMVFLFTSCLWLGC